MIAGSLSCPPKAQVNESKLDHVIHLFRPDSRYRPNQNWIYIQTAAYPDNQDANRYPWPIKIIGVIKGTEVQEKQIRHILRDYSIDREWLDPHPTVLAAIELALERGEKVSCRIRPKKEYNSKLATFLEEQGITDAEFGRQIGVERHTVGRYKAGDRFPSKHILLKIHKVTQGQVTANDFANLPNNPVRA